MESEIEILYQINCTHIPKLYAVYETDNTVSLILDLLNGGNLYTKIVNDEEQLTEK